MNENAIYNLLTVIKNNGNVKRLIREGLDYNMIGKMTNQAISDRLIIYENDNIYLSSEGIRLLTELEKKYKIQDKRKWIEPKNECKIPTLGKNFIFLPQQDELHF